MLCELCKAVKDDYRLIYEDDLVFCVVVKCPLKKGHIMVLPKRHVEKMSELTHEEAKKLFEVLNLMKERIEKRYDTSVVIEMNSGENSSQRHLHIHIVPFEKGGLRTMMSSYEKIPERKEIPEEDMERMRDEILENI